jgi:serine/threonine-protein kinase
MITPGGQTKLLDFGAALTKSEPGLTKQGFMLGSLSYMAPEHIRGEVLDARCDIYATGVTFYEVLTGRLPIEGNSEYEIMMGHLNREPRSPLELNPQIPPSLSAMIMKALAKNPAQRFQTAAEFLTALQATARERQTVSQAVPGPPPLSNPEPSQTYSLCNCDGAIPIDATVVDRISKELAVYIGPIARIVVKRAAPRCSTIEELYFQVAGEIESERDRKSFLSARRLR